MTLFVIHSLCVDVFLLSLLLRLLNLDESLVATLYRENKIPANLFSMCLSEHGGSMTIGVVDTNRHTGQLAYAKLDPELALDGLYGVLLADMQIGHLPIGVPETSYSGIGFLLANALKYTYLPRSLKAMFETAFGRTTGLKYEAASPGCKGYTYQQIATRFVKIQLVLRSAGNGSNIVLEVSPSQYLVQMSSGRYCGALLWIGNDYSLGFIGANLLVNRDVIFDRGNRRLGFADADCTYHTQEPANQTSRPSDGAQSSSDSLDPSHSSGHDAEVSFGSSGGSNGFGSQYLDPDAGSADVLSGSTASSGSGGFGMHSPDRDTGSAAVLSSAAGSSGSGGFGSLDSGRDAGSVAASSGSSEFKRHYPGGGAGSSGSSNVGKRHRGRAEAGLSSPSTASGSNGFGRHSPGRDAGSDLSFSASASYASEVAYGNRGPQDFRPGSASRSSVGGDAVIAGAGDPFSLTATVLQEMRQTLMLFLVVCIGALVLLAVVIVLIRRRQLGAALLWQELDDVDDDEPPSRRESSPRRTNEMRTWVRPHFRLLPSPLPCTQVVIEHRDDRRGRGSEEELVDDPSRPQIVAL